MIEMVNWKKCFRVKKRKWNKYGGKEMRMCESCKHGHECPYIGKTDDMLHAFLEGDSEIEGLKEEIDNIGEALEARIKEVFEVSKRFHFGFDMVECEGFEAYEVAWSDKDVEMWHALVIELYGLAGDCRSKVGVRVPFYIFDAVVVGLEKYLSVVESGKVVGRN